MAEHSTSIAMVAGEASGDLLGAHLLAALRAQRSGLRFNGIGGPRMQAIGFRSHFPMETLSVRGYAEALRHYRKIVGVRRHLAARLLRERPAVFVGVDAPDFNLALERRLKDADIPTVHYVSPSIWAWRGGRIRVIGRSIGHMLALFPFEAPIYERAGIPVTYVGHPLADDIPLEVDKTEARVQLRLPGGKRIVALLPGSRQSELQYMADVFVKTALRFVQDANDVHFVCPMASRETRDLFQAALHRNGAERLPLTLLFGHSHEALAAAEVALVASGTATLEAALLRTPMVITYRMSQLSWMLMRRMAYLPYAGLPNVLAGEFLVPELLQDKATPDALCATLFDLLYDPARQRYQVAKFREIHVALRRNAAAKAADVILGMLSNANRR